MIAHEGEGVSFLGLVVLLVAVCVILHPLSTDAVGGGIRAQTRAIDGRQVPLDSLLEQIDFVIICFSGEEDRADEDWLVFEDEEGKGRLGNIGR